MEKKQTELDKEVALKNKELRESRDDVSDLTVRLHEERLRKQTSLDQWKRTEEGLLRKIAGLERSTECKPDLVAVEKCDILHQQLTHCQSEIRNKNLELEKQASKIKMLQEQVTRDRLKSITTPLHGKILSADTVTPEQFDRENTGAIPRVSPVLSFDAEKFSNDENDQIGVVKTSRGLQEVCNKVNSSGVQSDTMNPKKVSFAVVRPVGGRAALKEKLKRARGLVR